jgi:hypothetical protein
MIVVIIAGDLCHSSPTGFERFGEKAANVACMYHWCALRLPRKIIILNCIRRTRCKNIFSLPSGYQMLAKLV